MRLIRVVFSIRALMILVTLIGCGVGGWKLRERSRAFAVKAEDFAFRRDLAKFICGTGLPHDPTERKAMLDAMEAHNQKRKDYYATLEQKYQAASKRPWLSVEPDPPPP